MCVRNIPNIYRSGSILKNPECVCVLGLRAKSLVQSLIHFTDEETEAQENETICESGSLITYILTGYDSVARVKLFWLIIFKTHYKTQRSSSPCNSVSNNEEILSSYWNQPSNIQVSSSQRWVSLMAQR